MIDVNGLYTVMTADRVQVPAILTADNVGFLPIAP